MPMSTGLSANDAMLFRARLSHTGSFELHELAALLHTMHLYAKAKLAAVMSMSSMPRHFPLCICKVTCF